MNESQVVNDNCRTPERYEIRVQGHLEDNWAEWFECLTLQRESDGTTLLHSQLADQSALHGVLQKIRNMNMKLLSVKQVEHTTFEETYYDC